EKTICWYACKHSEAEDLAKVLSQVYAKIIQLPASSNIKDKASLLRRELQKDKPNQPQNSENVHAPLIVQPPAVAPTDTAKNKAVEIHDNFIVDNKTNSIVMVVEAYVI